jgi:hypothetical protein
MTSAMTSRDRVLAAIRRQQVDHVPLLLRLWSVGGGPDLIPFAWRDQVQRAEALQAMGVDDTLLLEPPMGYTEEYHADQSALVSSEVRLLEPAGAGEYPVLEKRYDTPDGLLTQAIKLTEDWPHGRDIMLFSDFNIPRQVKPPVQTLDDVRRLPHLLADPTPAQVAEFEARSRRLRAEANRLGVALEGGWSALGDSAAWLLGTDGVHFGQADDPKLVGALLDVLLEWELKRMDRVLAAGVDVYVHMAWYEGTDFWSPRSYRKYLVPRLRYLVDRAHTAGAPFRYIITKGWFPLRDELLDLGIDCISGVDPVQDRLNLEEAKRAVGSRICLMGGLNAAVTVTQGNEEQVRDAVDEALRVLAPGGGHILWPVDNIFCELPWEKTEVLIDRWRQYW